MSKIVKMIDSEPKVSSLIIAENSNNQHKSIMQLCRKYIDELRSFGRVTFEMLPFETNGGVQKKEIIYLNEQQVYLLLTFMKNSSIIIKFKIALVREFFKMRELLQNEKRVKEDRDLLEFNYRYFLNTAMMDKLEYLYGKEATQNFYAKLIPNIDYKKSKKEKNITTEHFIENHIITKRGAKLPTTQLYQRYLEFCEKNQISRYNKIQFFRIFREIKRVPKINLLSVSRFRGVRKRYFENLEVTKEIL